MTAAQHKIVRDVWQERGRTLIVVLAIAVGIAGFTAVLSAYSILTRELNKGYLSTNPPSVTLRTDRVDDSLIKAVLASGAVAEAEARRVMQARIKTGPMEWRNLALFVVKDFTRIRVGKLQRDGGAWPPKPGEMLIERNAFQVAHTKIGDIVAIKIAGQNTRHLRIAGSVHDVGQAQARMENIVYGYITMDTVAQLGQAPYLDQLNIVVAGDRFDERHIRSVATEVTAVLEGLRHPVRKVDVPAPGKHPHADIMRLLLLDMSVFGFAILLLSSILVINLLTALMAAQVRQIGMMKAIGARRWQVAGIYFGEVSLLGVAAVVLALPPGIVGGRVLCRYLAVLLNFDMTSFAVPGWVYLLVLAAGIVVPLAVAAYPVLKGSGITVRLAMVDFGVSPDSFGATPLDRMLATIGGTLRPLLMVMRNTLRRRERLAITVLTLAASGLFFMSALNIRASLIRTLDRSFASKRYDLWVTFNTLYPFADLQHATRGIEGIKRAEGWIVTEGSFIAPDDHFALIALPPRTTLVRLRVVSGRALGPGDSDAIVVNSALAAKRPTLKIGDAVNLRTGPSVLQWRVVGIAREPFSAPTAYVSKRRLDDLGRQEGMANSLRIALDKPDAATLNAAKAVLDRNFEHDGLRALESTTKAESRYGFDQHMVMIYVFLLVTSAIIAVVGGLGLMTATTLNVMERRREIGILRAIGATPWMISLTVIAESVVTGVVSWAVAALVAWPVSRAVGDWLISALFQTGLDFHFEPIGLAAWLAVSISIAIVASVLPALRASRSTVRETLAWT